MKRFEYDVVYMKTEVSDASSQGTISHQVRKVLNAMGSDGWELVSGRAGPGTSQVVPQARVADREGLEFDHHHDHAQDDQRRADRLLRSDALAEKDHRQDDGDGHA